MDIIIKGQDKPLFCLDCPCFSEEYNRCQTKGNWEKGVVYGEPPEWCPIEGLPEE